ncbi:hypothetical protein GY45DRAFT_1295002 [Cubamyces sp. BRFM 1775]|nr:hypothetical protein GY45DRAFT_1295002 [Cubamyces sp. BRFM 1775]
MIDRSDVTCSRFPDLQAVKDIIRGGRTITASYEASVVESDGIIVKFGRRIYKSEAMAMQLVRSATPIPLPYCYAYFSESTYNGQDRCGYLVMEKAPGIPLVDLLPRLDERSCDIIASQLHSHISSLRALSRRGTWGMVGRDGVYHGGFFSYLHEPIDAEQMCRGNPCVASSMQHVLDYFAKALDTLRGPDPEVGRLLSYIDSTTLPVFSHGDLVPENILVDERTCTITSIIDWERAGWYPYFWDNTIASFRKSAYQKNLVTYSPSMGMMSYPTSNVVVVSSGLHRLQILWNTCHRGSLAGDGNYRAHCKYCIACRPQITLLPKIASL